VDEPSESSKYTTEEDDILDNSSSRNESDDSKSGNNEGSKTFENYTSSNYEPFQDPLETATEALIKYMKLILIEIRGDDFKDFSDLNYLTRKQLRLKDQFIAS
ncbi:16533_t:CDS:2, partial [Funneliformis geosporum]